MGCQALVKHEHIKRISLGMKSRWENDIQQPRLRLEYLGERRIVLVWGAQRGQTARTLIDVEFQQKLIRSHT